jgi:hypothetical protein
MPTRPAQSPSESEARARCSRCEAFLARDNSEDYCSPCGSYYAEIEFQRQFAAHEVSKREERERKRMARALTLDDVPLPGHPDKEPPEIVRLVVLAFAKGGSYEAVHRLSGVGHERAQRMLRRVAAREMIESMVEEGTWPVGRSTSET